MAMIVSAAVAAVFTAIKHLSKQRPGYVLFVGRNENDELILNCHAIGLER